MCKEVLPGDTFQPVTAKVVRCQTMLTPIMDNMYLDTYYFFVPNRIIWKHWKEFCGENTQSAWAPTTKYKIPAINPILWRAYKDSDPAGGADDTSVEKFKNVTSPTGICGFPQYSIGDYLGYPTKIGADTGEIGKVGDHWKNVDVRFSALPFRAYAKVCDHFFRDENVTDPLLIPDDDADVDCATMDASYVSGVALGGKPFKVSKYHDYFSSCLPAAQKGDPVTMPIDLQGTITGASFPVYPTGDFVPGVRTSIFSAGGKSYINGMYVDSATGSGAGGRTYPLMLIPSTSKFGDSVKVPFKPLDYGTPIDGLITTEADFDAGVFAQDQDRSTGNANPVRAKQFSYDDVAPSGTGNEALFPANLWAVADNSAISASGAGFDINQFRLAYVTQCFLERLARGGSRYGELVLSLFGVSNPDSRLQDPEYLGGNRCPIQVEEVVNTAQTGQDFLGDVGAKCQTNDIHADFVKSFTEHGILLGVMCIRYDHAYCQGINRSWTREDFLDFYNPVFANLGEMPVYKHQLYASPSTLTADDKGIAPVFGYQEAWADYRFSPNMCTAEMRPNADQTLSQWHWIQ